jgi:hypothetical protein
MRRIVFEAVMAQRFFSRDGIFGIGVWGTVGRFGFFASVILFSISMGYVLLHWGPVVEAISLTEKGYVVGSPIALRITAGLFLLINLPPWLLAKLTLLWCRRAIHLDPVSVVITEGVLTLVLSVGWWTLVGRLGSWLSKRFQRGLRT